MVFSSVIFVFLFLPAVLFAYFLCPKKFLFLRNLILLGSSLAFYFYGEPKYIVVMLFSIGINYLFGILIHNEQQRGGKGRIVMYISVVVNLAVLVYFKYLLFITENINVIFGGNIAVRRIIMPIGISFFTFQAMSYVFDVYHKTAEVQKNPLNVALYISMFPQLIAGPIVRYSTVAAEIKERTVTTEKFSQGVNRFINGFSKKIILANSMGAVADHVFSINSEFLTTDVAWIGALAYSLQIYYDFSGYSDMAIGLGKMFGFTFLENFNFPYISKSITEFWRRWHMSLGTWFRDYVYIPLGGNRVTFSRHILNISVVWFLTGFWHGAAWNFVVWGIYFAIILIMEKVFVLKTLSKFPTPISHIYALILIIVGWVIFRSDNLLYAIRYAATMFNPLAFTVSDGRALYFIREYRFEWLAAIIFSIPLHRVVSAKLKRYVVVHYVARLIFTFAIFGLSILYLINSTFNPFIYFRF